MDCAIFMTRLTVLCVVFQLCYFYFTTLLRSHLLDIGMSICLFQISSILFLDRSNSYQIIYLKHELVTYDFKSNKCVLKYVLTYCHCVI